MKKLLLSSAAACAFAAFAAPAFAADLPVAPVEPIYVPPAAVFTWTGFYVGVNAGYAWSEFDFQDNNLDIAGTDTFFLDPVVLSGSYDLVDFEVDEIDGFVGGAQIGYNWQVNQFVFGVEGDLQAAGLDSDDDDNFSGAVDFPFDDYATGVEADLDYFGTVRARAGFALDRFMVYATGGLAYGGADVEVGFADASGDVTTADDDQTHIGYAVGAGVEGAITDNLTAKIEYLYVDLGEQSYDFEFSDGGADASLSSDVDIDAHVVRAGLNFKFNSLFGGY